MPIILQTFSIVLYELQCFLFCIKEVFVDVNEPCFFTCISRTLISLDCTLIDYGAPSSENVGDYFIVSIHSGDFLISSTIS